MPLKYNSTKHIEKLTWVRIVGNNFVAAAEVDSSGTIIRTAPILRWLIGKKLSDIPKNMSHEILKD